MQKLRIASVWNDNTKSYEKEIFDLTESENIIYGKINISSKKDGKYIGKTLPFIAFKSKIDELTTFALLHSKGKLFDAEFNLMVDSFNGNNGKIIDYIKLVINKARFEERTTQNNSQPAASEEIIDDEINF